LPLQLFVTIVFSALSIYTLIKSYDTFLSCNVEETNTLMKYSLTIGLLLSIIITISELGTYFFKEWKKSLVQVEQFKTQSIQAQLANLKNQINPHFLFNNLSVLSGLVYKNQDKSADFINQLSKVYRYMLDNRNTELISIKEELQFLQSYNYLLQIRFDKGLHIELDIPDTVLQKQILPMCLQMLVENAIKHNETSIQFPLTISIIADINKITVKNNLQPRTIAEASTKSGLKNIEDRYAFYTNQKIEIVSTDKIFFVTLPILQTIS
jgi:two-component system, LytTR family, sensor kinase